MGLLGDLERDRERDMMGMSDYMCYRKKAQRQLELLPLTIQPQPLSPIPHSLATQTTCPVQCGLYLGRSSASLYKSHPFGMLRDTPIDPCHVVFCQLLSS